MIICLKSSQFFSIEHFAIGINNGRLGTENSQLPATLSQKNCQEEKFDMTFVSGFVPGGT
jgi:hypothetical protein